MPIVRKTAEVDEDLRRIAAYIMNDSVSAALDWVERTELLFQMLSTQPELGEQITTRRYKEARRYAHGNYVIYYQPLTGGVLERFHGGSSAISVGSVK
jgi:plasmid stabilization system protein ParE